MSARPVKIGDVLTKPANCRAVNCADGDYGKTTFTAEQLPYLEGGCWAIHNLLIDVGGIRHIDGATIAFDDSVAAADPVNHPAHYTAHPSGVECIAITEHMNFCVGNAVKYLWRAGLKGSSVEDLRKARWYIDREIERVSR